eukprot:3312114-Pyramimonas_sp.AAC.1
MRFACAPAKVKTAGRGSPMRCALCANALPEASCSSNGAPAESHHSCRWPCTLRLRSLASSQIL